MIFLESNFRDKASEDGITHISTGIAVVRDNKILIVRRAADDYLGGQYELPGGGVDAGENITDAAIRELNEETGLTATKVLRVFDGFDYTTDRKPRVRQINFLVEVKEGEITLEPKEHDEFQWAEIGTDLDSLMSGNMKACVEEALQLVNQNHLYLLILEVDRLVIGDEYPTLPSHLTLVSRFKSELDFNALALAVKPIVENTLPIQLSFDDDVVIGPKNTFVHLVEKTQELENLHLQILKTLNSLNVTYTLPEYIAEGYLPHISSREGASFKVGHSQSANHAYLIEVAKTKNKDIRIIRTKF